jgi:hypothetical protein
VCFGLRDKDFEQRQREQASVVALLILDIQAQKDDFEQRQTDIRWTHCEF